MEQQLTGGGVPYLFTLYGNPGKVLQTRNASHLFIGKEEFEYIANIDFDDLYLLVNKSIDIVKNKLSATNRSVVDNLSPEGKVIIIIINFIIILLIILFTF